MITAILPYVGSYADVRSVCGLNAQELTDTELALVRYVHILGLALDGISGVYTPETESQTLYRIYVRPLVSTDTMYGLIELYSMYIVADAVMESVGLKAYKTLADGKSTLTRFSPESTYLSVRTHIKEMLDGVRADIEELLGETIEDKEYLEVVEPDVDLITGE